MDPITILTALGSPAGQAVLGFLATEAETGITWAQKMFGADPVTMQQALDTFAASSGRFVAENQRIDQIEKGIDAAASAPGAADPGKPAA